jgi:hypothetical protein
VKAAQHVERVIDSTPNAAAILGIGTLLCFAALKSS